MADKSIINPVESRLTQSSQSSTAEQPALAGDPSPPNANVAATGPRAVKPTSAARDPWALDLRPGTTFVLAVIGVLIAAFALIAAIAL